MDAGFISVRRGYHFIPKHIMGKFADVFAHDWPHLPMWLAQKVMHGILKMINGDITRFGLPEPDHKIFESHPIVNSQLLHYLGHGDVTAKGNVERLDCKHVVFKDGSYGPFTVPNTKGGKCEFAAAANGPGSVDGS
ncbi:MAG TPA: hypothetical protein ENH56_08795 [Roseobacter sp.]|uniref:Uncharacterized protein n=1 Tax=marine sediment metagenome TaxID=412755 RepID=A0A0F9RRL7_9ZZZZ|nr:hypothetical protein [Roseobacter sp.]